MFNHHGKEIRKIKEQYETLEKEVEKIKEQYETLEKEMTTTTDEPKRMEKMKKLMEEMKSIIDLLSAYGNQGVSATLDLIANTKESDIRIFAYKKIEQIKKPKTI